MIVIKRIENFIVRQDDTLLSALEKIEFNKHKIVYVVDSRSHLLGALADGDFRRWAIANKRMSPSVTVEEVYNSDCYYMDYHEPKDKIEAQLANFNRSIPLVDNEGHLLAIVEKGSDFFTVGDHRISKEDPAYIIAEIGNNHQGDINLAKHLVDLAVKSGVDCVKFQMRSMDALYGRHHAKEHAHKDLGAQYTLDLLTRFQLSDDEMYQIFDYCKSKPITPLCTPWDLASLSKLENYGMLAYKVASADLTNFELLEAIAETGKLMICSTGMATEDEIVKTIAFLERKKANFILLHCNSTYPAPYKDINLRYMTKLQKLGGGVVGYSGHERGISVPVAAIAMGAKVIEKHFTTDKSLEGNDHKVSLLPDEMHQMVRDIRAVEVSLGGDNSRILTQGELLNREVLAKSLFINCDLAKGQIFDRDMIEIKSPGNGMQPNRVEELVGRESLRYLKSGDMLFPSDITGQLTKKEKYLFDRPVGIPVRYHDFEALTKDVLLDFVEFHLSYGDLDLRLEDYLKFDTEMGFAVHAPELFSGDHLLDLASLNDEYRERSIQELSRVLDVTRRLKEFYPSTKLPVVVVNVGGWNSDGFLKKEIVHEMYGLVKTAFSELDLGGLQIAIQTMPPFPWHFGGQSYHNLFVDADEMVEFCKDTGLRLCLDISHSMMACNFYKKDLYKFVEKVVPYCVHLHIVDAKGDDGEGIQIGQGDVDFSRLSKLLRMHAPDVQFIPEVWQGHKNAGEGFWQALDYLEKKL